MKGIPRTAKMLLFFVASFAFHLPAVDGNATANFTVPGGTSVGSYPLDMAMAS